MKMKMMGGHASLSVFIHSCEASVNMRLSANVYGQASISKRLLGFCHDGGSGRFGDTGRRGGAWRVQETDEQEECGCWQVDAEKEKDVLAETEDQVAMFSKCPVHQHCHQQVVHLELLELLPLPSTCLFCWALLPGHALFSATITHHGLHLGHFRACLLHPAPPTLHCSL